MDLVESGPEADTVSNVGGYPAVAPMGGAAADEVRLGM
jgi:hypothetical protein